jgi:hypothetical protein
MTAGAAMALAAQWGLPRLVRLTPSSMMALGAALALAGNALPLAWTGALAAGTGFALASFGYGLARPGFSAAASLAGHDAEQVAIGAATSLIAGASIILPPVIAATALGLWPSAPFALAIVFIVSGWAVMRLGAIVFRER